MKIKETATKVKDDYVLRSFLTSSVSFIITIAFLIYNFVIGIIYQSVWNISISVYYLCLILMRAYVIFSEKKWRDADVDAMRTNRVKLLRRICRFLILVDFALVVPITLMVLSQRSVGMTMIPAIGIAAYTTYKVTFAILNYKKTRNSENLSLYSLRIINLKDAMVSILSLQNTLVMVFGDSKSMIKLTATTSAAMVVGMIVLTILLLVRSKKYKT